MMILILGGSGSGKSACAEEYMSAVAKECSKYYIATMQVFDKEGRERIERHRKMRQGKGFITIEQPLSIEEARNKMEHLPLEENAALLECISNLTANEMFSEEVPISWEVVAGKILSGVELLNKSIKHLIIVSGNVFEDGIEYDETTIEYMKAMGSINEKLAAMADCVIEVVAGIEIVCAERRKPLQEGE